MKVKNTKKLLLATAILLAPWPITAMAQEANVIPDPTDSIEVASDEIEEVVVTGRFIDSSQQLINERMDDAFAADLLGADTISHD